MKSTGIIRKVDELGRIVIPKEIRTKFGICEGDPMEFFVEGSQLSIEKYEPDCIFCGSSKKLVSYNDKLICTKCAERLNKLSEKV